MKDVDRSTSVDSKGRESNSEAPSVLDDAGRALFRLGRMFDRQRVNRIVTEKGGMSGSVELSRIFAVQAVEAELERTETEVTVGTVAERLEIDRSTASRLVADTIADGYLLRTPSQADGRRARLKLTDAGRRLAEDARGYQRTVFEDLTRDWSERDREEFARLLTKFTESAAGGNLSPAPPRV